MVRSRDHVPLQRGASGEGNGGQRRRFARASSCGCAARGLLYQQRPGGRGAPGAGRGRVAVLHWLIS